MYQPYNFQQQLLCTQDRDSFSYLWLITGIGMVTNSKTSPGLPLVPGHSKQAIQSVLKTHQHDTRRPESRKENDVLRNVALSFFYIQVVAQDWWEQEKISTCLHSVRIGWKVNDSLSLPLACICDVSKLMAVWEQNGPCEHCRTIVGLGGMVTTQLFKRAKRIIKMWTRIMEKRWEWGLKYVEETIYSTCFFGSWGNILAHCPKSQEVFMADIVS